MGCGLRVFVWLVLHPLWIGLLLAGLYHAYIGVKLTAFGSKVDSVVVDAEVHPGNRGSSPTIAPIYEYTFHGATYRHVATGASSTPAHKLGEHVALRIADDDPGCARVDSFEELWLLPAIFIPLSLALGVVMLFVGWLVSRFGRVTSVGSVRINP